MAKTEPNRKEVKEYRKWKKNQNSEKTIFANFRDTWMLMNAISFS